MRRDLKLRYIFYYDASPRSDTEGSDKLISLFRVRFTHRSSIVGAPERVLE